MGCMNSKSVGTADAGPVPADLIATGGGSMILAGPPKSSQQGSGVMGSEGDFLQSKGGSYIIGKKDAGAWEPGATIVRPDNTPETQVCYVSVGNDQVLRITYACRSLQGRSPKPPHKPNQDSFLALPGLGNEPSTALFGVFDGHGPRGEDASNFVRINLPDLCIRNPEFNKNVFEAVTAGLEHTHKRFINPATQRSGVDTAVSGTTAITITFQGNHWMCANVGDSRAMLASRNANGALVAKPLSIDHKPSRDTERARINKSPAKVLSEKQLGIEGGDPDKLYVCRVHNGAIRYGVLFTRSIGDADAHANLGLVATPEVKKGVINGDRDRFMVLASDGVWDFLGEDAVARIVAQSTGMAVTAASMKGDLQAVAAADVAAADRAQAAVDALVLAAEARWEAESDRRRDDITAVVLFTRMLSKAEALAEQKQREQAAAAAVAGDAAAEGDDEEGVEVGDGNEEEGEDDGEEGSGDGEDEEEEEEGEEGDSASDAADAATGAASSTTAIAAAAVTVEAVAVDVNSSINSNGGSGNNPTVIATSSSSGGAS